MYIYKRDKLYKIFCFYLFIVPVWSDYTAFQEEIAIQQATNLEKVVSKVQKAGGNVCENCGRIYKQKNALWRHFKYECGKNPRFQCPYCRYRTKQRSNMYTHVKYRHIGQKIYAIDLESNN